MGFGRLTATLFAVSALAPASSCSYTPAFECTNHDQCDLDQGRCESNGFCSFPDSSCDSGRRYGARSGAQTGRCVVGETGSDGSVGGPDAGNTDAPTGTVREWTVRIKASAVTSIIDDYPMLLAIRTHEVFTVLDTIDRLAFFDTTETRLAHEVERFDAIAEELWVWVKVPQLHPSLDTDLKMRVFPTAQTQDSGHAVWDRYAGVWHMTG